MKFSTKSRYALRLMAELARYAPGTTVSLKEISERQNLSLKYLEQIVTPLARVGLVKSERGSQGFTLPFWAGLDEVINQYIDSVTLEQLAQSLPAAKDGCCGCNTKT